VVELVHRRESLVDRRVWGRVARVCGYVAGGGILMQTVLYLLDVTDLLAKTPSFVSTGNAAQNVANYYSRYFARQHKIVWDIALRDTIGPIGLLALLVLVVAAAALLGPGRPEAVLMVTFVGVGVVLHVVQDLVYLSLIHWWRGTGWDPVPGLIIPVGRAAESIDSATTYVEAASYVVLLCGLACLGLLLRGVTGIPRWLPPLVFVEAAGMLVLAVGEGFDQQTLFRIGGLLTGVLLGPLVVISLGRALSSNPE
jgi:hypothetical protein